MSSSDDQRETAAREDESGSFRLSAFLQRVWVSVTASLNLQ
jgi:hypothetical protein